MKKDIQKEILKKIEKGELRMKPKWQFEAKEKGTKGALVSILVLGALALSMVIFFIKEYEPWTLWELGEVGKQIILEDFPYWWFLGGIAMVIASTIVIKSVGNNYKKTEKEIWIMTMASTIVITIAVWIIRGLF